MIFSTFKARYLCIFKINILVMEDTMHHGFDNISHKNLLYFEYFIKFLFEWELEKNKKIYSRGVFQSSRSFLDWTWRVRMISVPKWRQPRREARQRAAVESRFSELTRSTELLVDVFLWTFQRKHFVHFSEWSWARSKWLWAGALLEIFLLAEWFFQFHTLSWWSGCRWSWNLCAGPGTESSESPNFCLKLDLSGAMREFQSVF